MQIAKMLLNSLLSIHTKSPDKSWKRTIMQKKKKNGKCGAADRKALRFIKIGLRSALRRRKLTLTNIPDARFPRWPKRTKNSKNKSRPATAYAKMHCKTWHRIKLRWNAYRIDPNPNRNPNCPSHPKAVPCPHPRDCPQVNAMRNPLVEFV